MLRRVLFSFTVLVSGSAIGGCGFGGDDYYTFGPDVSVRTLSIVSEASADGAITGEGDVFTASEPAAGNDNFEVTTRGFFRFRHGITATGATVRSAMLRIYQREVVGTPYVMSPLFVDHVDLGAGLDGTDYNAPAIEALFGVLSTDDAVEYKTVDVTAQVQADLSRGSPTCDFRVRFNPEADSDGIRDYCLLTDGENTLGTGSQPVLLITLEP